MFDDAINSKRKQMAPKAMREQQHIRIHQILLYTLDICIYILFFISKEDGFAFKRELIIPFKSEPVTFN